jgi:Cytochrome c7 and related cytochrome c
MQLFPKSLNKLPLVAAIAINVVGAALTVLVWYYLTPKNFQVGYAPVQPVPYNHSLHAGQMGMDCRYCHANVERAAHAQVPPTQTCMGCHALVKTESGRLANIRKSWESGKPVEWVKVHKLPDHAYFNHSAHLNIAVGDPAKAAAIGCATCHGRIDQMEVVRLDQPIAMGWCLECHRDPTPNLRPKDQATNMAWKPEMAKNWTAPEVHPPQHCSGCHR